MQGSVIKILVFRPARILVPNNPKLVRAAAGVMVFVSMSLLLTGCMTSKLWEGEMIESFHEPASPDRLALFQWVDGGSRGIIVQYDELSPWRSSARRRTFFLRENVDRIDRRRKPNFVDDASAAAITKSAEPIPIVAYTNLMPATVSAGSNHGFLCAVRFGDGEDHSFTIVRSNGATEGPYHLPGYRGATGNLRLAGFTPVTITADATIIIGVAAWFYLYALAQSGGGVIWPSCR